jgi:hypothetical protein
MADPDTNPRCPTCGARGIPLVYGYPDDGLMEAAERGQVDLGGCVLSDDDPTRTCSRGHTWGRLSDRARSPLTETAAGR